MTAAANGPLRSQVREGEPVLEGVKLGDRWAVIFSPYDISCALENRESLECEGYTRKDAARIDFDDDLIYREVATPIAKRKIPMKQLLRTEALPAFKEWQGKAGKVRY